MILPVSEVAATGGPRIHVLLPVHNRRAVTERFIQCLSAQTFRDMQLILVDDGSVDGTSEMVREYFPETVIIRGNGKWWWAGSLQRGFNWLELNQIPADDLVLIINDDVTFGPDYLMQGHALMRDRRRTLLLSQYRRADGVVSESGVHANLDRLTFDVAGSADQINCLSTRGLFARWGDLAEIGGFHPRVLPHYLSDYEYTIRAHRKGFKCETHSAVTIIPDHTTTGFHKVQEPTLSAFLKKYFSKRSAANPVYWTSFVVLVCSPRQVPSHLFRLWKDSLRLVARTAVHRQV